MLDIEVVLVVEDGHRLAVVRGLASVLSALGRDGDGGEIDLLVHVGCLRRSSSHRVALCVARELCVKFVGGFWRFAAAQKSEEVCVLEKNQEKKIGALSMAGIQKSRGSSGGMDVAAVRGKKKLQWR